MKNQISEHIVSRVKNKLGITDPSIEVSVVYERLCKALVKSHPDLFTDEFAKKKAEERFKEFNSMRNELKAYIEQQSASGKLVLYDDKAEMASVKAITITADQEVRISELEHEIRMLKFELEYAKSQLRVAEQKASEIAAQAVVVSKDSISDIYKPKKIGNTIGISAAIISMSALIPQVQTIVGNLGVCGIIGSVVVWSVTLVWLLRLFRNAVSNKYVESIIDKTIVGTDLFDELKVSSSKNYSRPYFSEKSLLELVENIMNKRAIHLLFWGKYNSIRRQIVEHIILELECKHIIVDSKNNDMQRLFYIEHSVINSDSLF